MYHAFITFIALLLRLNNRWRTKFKALPILVPPRGYLMLLMRRNTLALLLLRWKSSISHVREENNATPTRVRCGDTLNEDTMVLTNSRQRRKLPRPAASILPDPSIRKTRSRRLLQTETQIKQLLRNQQKLCLDFSPELSMISISHGLIGYTWTCYLTIRRQARGFYRLIVDERPSPESTIKVDRNQDAV